MTLAAMAQALAKRFPFQTVHQATPQMAATITENHVAKNRLATDGEAWL